MTTSAESLRIPEPINSFFDAVHRQDEQNFLDAFTDDGSVDDWGSIYTGRAAIKGWSDREFIGASGTLSVESAEKVDGAVIVVGDWRSSFANGPSKFTFSLDGDKITRMEIREG